MSEILIKEFRGNIVENVHRGSIAVVSSTGDTIAYLGDIEKQTFMRSASKPIQVLPTLLAGLHRRFNLTEENVAMFNSSHWGSNHHIFVLEEISRKTGIDPEDMIMKPCSSTSASALAKKLTDQSRLHPRDGISKLQHCCSGKHFSLMLLQRELTGKTSGYEQKDSPVQRQIINFISMLSQTPTFKIGLGIDGCGVPVFALPLRSIAMSYAKLMDPFSLSNELRETIDYNFSCIHKYPEKINDYGTPSYYINQNPDLIMKDGSRGVICMAIKSMKLGIAVKLEDGWTDEFQGLIIANILEQLKYEDTDLIEKLKNCYTTKLYNDCGIEVGHFEVDFKLTIDPTFFEKPEEYVDSDLEDLDTESEEGADGVKDYDPDEDSAFVEDEEESDADPDTEIDPFPDLWGERKESYDNPGVTALNIDAIDKGTPNKNASNKDIPGKDVSGSVITPNNDKTEGKTNTLSPEEERAIRNKKSILGMTVVRPSTNRTVISNPLVDPISAKPKVETTDSAPTADETPSGSGQVLANAQISGHREIKSANIISQKKRDE
jgi:L-asparaginase II